MAKRYYDHDTLLSLEVGVGIKATGTLGRHYFVVGEISPEKNIQIWGRTSSGEYIGPVYVRPGGQLGYDKGQVWAIKPMSEMNPLEAFRSRYLIGRDKIRFVSPAEMAALVLPEEIPHPNPEEFPFDPEESNRWQHCHFDTENHYWGGRKPSEIAAVHICRKYKGNMGWAFHVEAVYLAHGRQAEALKEAERLLQESREAALTWGLSPRIYWGL